MAEKAYMPQPIDTSSADVSEELLTLGELLAKNTHEIWAQQRIREGWRFGEHRDDGKKLTPCLVPYEELPENEKEYDRNTSMETIRVILSLGYRITKNTR